MNPKRLLTSVLATACLVAFPAVSSEATDGGAVHPPLRSDHLTTHDLAKRGSGGFPQYRIPALTTSEDGTLIAAYDGRPGMADLPSHISVLVRRSTDDGKTWSPPEVVRSAPAPKGFGDPSLLTDRQTGRVFLFYAGSVNEGYLGSETGNDNDDPDILHADYSYSDDGGRTWKHRRITSMIKDPRWGGLFAASGEGIQLRHGEHAGRLIQQYTVRYQGGNHAVSAYSDNHGRTWKTGELVGPGADENKTVELSDGTVMLNIRSAPYRKVAFSTDGGVTYSEPRQDTALTDPGNNGSITRYAPEAPAGDRRSRWLLFSNTEDTGIRRNLTVKMSCDDGETWPIERVVEPGAAAYSTLTPLPDGGFGLLYEREGYRYISYTSFGHAWLDGVCAPVTVDAPDSLQAGTTDEVAVEVTNQQQAATSPGTVVLDLPEGWGAPEVEVPSVEPGRTVRVTVPVTVPETAVGETPVTAKYRTQGRQSSGGTKVDVVADPAAGEKPGLSVLPVLDHLEAGGEAGPAGDVMTYWTRVTNTGNTALTDVTVTGNMDDLATCRYSSLAPGQSYVCRTAEVTVTEDDLRRGHYTPELTVAGTSPDGRRATATATGDRLDLR